MTTSSYESLSHSKWDLWARCYAVSTVGFEEAKIRVYIKNQEQLDGNGSGEKGNF